MDTVAVIDGYMPIYGVYQETPESGAYAESATEYYLITNSVTDSTERSVYIEATESHREICDFCIETGEGNFTSYGYPLNYRPLLNCSYRVRRTNNDVCELEMIFHDFDVPISKTTKIDNYVDCNEDYLEIFGRRFCGNQWQGRKEIVPFPANANEITFHFRTDDTISGRGFWIEVKQIPGTCFEKKALVHICEERFSEPEFYITSPRFPEEYPSNSECKYYIKKNAKNVCGLQLTFLHFDLEAVNDCFYDRLEMEGEKYCGNLPPNTIKMLPFVEDQKVLSFISDKQAVSAGFQIKVKQLTQCRDPKHLPPPPTCNFCTKDSVGILISYNYPNNYRNNLACMYHIEKKDSTFCSLQLNFNYFDVSSSPDCTQDYLLINGKRYCGSSLHSKIKLLEFESTDSVNLLFKTDASGTSKEVNKIRLCGTLQSETMRSYVFEENEKVVKFHTDSGTNREGFVIEINQLECQRETLDESSTVASVYYQPLHSSIHSSKTCDQTFNVEQFEITSPDYPKNYPLSTDCTFIIHKLNMDICRLDVTYHEFKIQRADTNGVCKYDYLDFNGIRVCGEVTQGSVRSFYFPEKTFNVTFHSDAMYSQKDTGFRLSVKQTECGSSLSKRVKITDSEYQKCNKLITTATFELKSPNYPENYPKNANCEYTVIKKPEGVSVCKLEVHFTDFHIEDDIDCTKDYVDFEGTRICGSQPKNNVKFFPFNKSMFTIRFKSDGKHWGFSNKNSFFLHVRQHECPDVFSVVTSTPQPIITTPTQTTTTPTPKMIEEMICDFIIRDSEFEIKSPMYPFRSVFNQSKVKVSLFKIDYLNITVTRRVQNANTLCKRDSPGQLGFHVRGKQVECLNYKSPIAQESQRISFERRFPDQNTITDKQSSKVNQLKHCDMTYSKSSIMLSSPNYPNNYPNDVHCTYTILRPNSSVCAVDMKFIVFDVEDDPKCAKDYLEIDTGKVCGHLPVNHERRYYYFPQESKKMLIFHSDSLASKSGFSVQIKQITDCTVHTWKPVTIYFPQFGTREIQFSFHADSRNTGRGFYIEYLQEICTSQIKPGNGHQYPPSYGLPSRPLDKNAQKNGIKGKINPRLQYPENHVYKPHHFEEIVESKVSELDSRSDQPVSMEQGFQPLVNIKPVSINVQLPDNNKTIQYSRQIFK
ncbi:hypothetical protein B4U80_09973 [Leptotrombidium deliense]|uniref:CUB domain-containing protein n=1 Tax=Leptotrombidium deliense TaxID=299467 RepID=A0A443SSW0_9ACAR|nr:hypothetical protein B4U80_09973 [Leptotrombidium deliense]